MHAPTLPQELLRMLHKQGKRAVAGRNSPRITSTGGGMVSVRDFIMGQSPHEAKEAQVGWGVTRDYYPALLARMVNESWRPWTYPRAWRKLTLAGTFSRHATSTSTS